MQVSTSPSLFNPPHGMAPGPPVAVSWLLVVVLLGWVAVTQAETLSCAGLSAEVESHEPGPVAEVCAGIGAAVGFLENYGLRQRLPLLIVLVDHPIAHRQQITYGTYASPRDRIEITSKAAIKLLDPPPRMFGQPLTGPMYGALVAHEVAHALAQQNSRVPQLGLVSQEYIGFATLLGALPEAMRLEVIDSSGVGAWVPGDTISEMYLELGPHNFAVKSYLHLTGLDDPQGFLSALLSNREAGFTVR